MTLDRDEHIADLDSLINAWRSAEYMAIRQDDAIAAREYRIRAETLEQVVRDLKEQPVVHR